MVVIPVLEDALDRSLLLAASMDSRGYGRTGDRSRRMVWVTGGLLVAGLAGICVGVYALLDGYDAAGPRVAAAGAGRGRRHGGHRAVGSRRTPLVVPAGPLAARRADRRGVRESTAGALVSWTSRVDPANLNPSLDPLSWPQVAWLPMVGILVGLVPAFATPLPVDTGTRADVRDLDVYA